MRLILLIYFSSTWLSSKSSIISVPPTYSINKTDLSISGKIHLNYLVETIKNNPNIVVQIRGQKHPLEEDSLIGIKRANNAMQYLIANGINKDRLELASIVYPISFYQKQYIKNLVLYYSNFEFSDSISMSSDLFNSSNLTQLELRVSGTDYPISKANIKNKIYRSDTIVNSVFGIITQKSNGSILRNSKLYFIGSDGSSIELISPLGLFYMEIKENISYNIQAKHQSTDTICGNQFQKHFISEKRLINKYNLGMFHNMSVENFNQIYDCSMPEIKFLTGDTLSNINKLKINTIVQLLLDNPTLGIKINYKTKQVYIDLISNYLEEKEIFKERFTFIKSSGFELNCWLVDKNKKRYPDLKIGQFVTKTTLQRYSDQTQKLLKPILDKKIHFEITSLKFKH